MNFILFKNQNSYSEYLPSANYNSNYIFIFNLWLSTSLFYLYLVQIFWYFWYLNYLSNWHIFTVAFFHYLLIDFHLPKIWCLGIHGEIIGCPSNIFKCLICLDCWLELDHRILEFIISWFQNLNHHHKHFDYFIFVWCFVQ